MIIQAVCQAEELGYDYVLTADHYQLGAREETGIPWSETYDAWILLSYLASRTSRIRLGTCVTPIPFRPPSILAKMISTFDILSNGRTIVGVGVGYEQQEFEAYSTWDPKPSVRVRKTREGLELMKRLWIEKKVNFKGKYYSAKDAILLPKPIQKPHPPLWFGVHGDYMMRLAAKYGNGWIPWTIVTPEAYAEGRRRIEEYAKALQRKDKFTFACVVGQLVAEKLRVPKLLHAPVIKESEWFGTVEKYKEAGCDCLVLIFRAGGKEYLKLMKRFAKEVIPSFIHH